jgi:hypothetical protein
MKVIEEKIMLVNIGGLPSFSPLKWQATKNASCNIPILSFIINT